MKVIDLLNKIANGEEVPKKIKYCIYGEEYSTFAYDEKEQEYYNDGAGYLSVPNHCLNDEVEIIEETKEIIEESENITEKERIFNYIHRQNKMLHKAIYDYLGEPYEYKNGKITPISQLKKDKDIEEIEYVVIFNAGYEDERLNKDFSNLCNKVNINTLKINELIRKIKKIKNN